MFSFREVFAQQWDAIDDLNEFFFIKMNNIYLLINEWYNFIENTTCKYMNSILRFSQFQYLYVVPISVFHSTIMFMKQPSTIQNVLLLKVFFLQHGLTSFKYYNRVQFFFPSFALF